MQFLSWPTAAFLAFSGVVGPSLPAMCGQQQSERGRQSASDGFVSIFDGKTLDGWHAVPKESASDWSVRDGVIVGHGSADRSSYLAWKDEHLTDFELELRYRLPGKGNTGVEIRSQPDLAGKRPFEGYHADLGHVGIGPHILGAWDFHFARRTEYPCPRGTRLIIDEDGKPHSSTIPGALTAADVRPHQWNDVRIIARGNHFQFFINGKPASEFTDNAKRGRLDQGAIGLQIHDKGMRVEFKDVRLKRPAPASQSEAQVPVGFQKQLLVDDYVIAEKHGVTREAGQAKKCGVVMEPTLPTDFQTGEVHDGPDGGAGYVFGESAFCWFISPHWDPDKKMFRLWYMASKRPGSHLAYAESRDGINWTKPLISRDGKSNLVNWNSPVPILRQNKTIDLPDIGADGITVTIDPSLPYGSPEKYKVAFYPNTGGKDCTTRLGYSADGIHWNLYNKGFPVTGRAADFSNQIFWDPIRKRYLLLCREDCAAGGGVGELRGVRIMEHEKDNDLMNHPAAWKTLTTFVLDDPDKTVIPGTQVPVYQIHTFPLWYHEGVYFALADVLAATNRPVPDGQQDYQKRHEKGMWEFYMAPSRDAVNFDFAAAAYPRKTLIPRGPDGSFDKDCARPPANIITHNDEHWIYYLGTNERWGARRWDARLGLAKLRLDGFFFLEAREKPGTVVTKPFNLEGGTLLVNVDAHTGRIQIEILDESGAPVPRFSRKDATQYQAVDDLRLKPAWKDNNDLSALKGKVVRIRFRLQSARLYAFQIQ